MTPLKTNLPGKREFTEKLVEKHPELTKEQAAKLIGTFISLLGSAITKNGGFELRGFAAMHVKQDEPKLKRNPRTGVVICDDEGHPVYYSRRRVATSVSSVIQSELNSK